MTLSIFENAAVINSQIPLLVKASSPLGAWTPITVLLSIAISSALFVTMRAPGSKFIRSVVLLCGCIRVSYPSPLVLIEIRA